jgi:hypothetical protein
MKTNHHRKTWGQTFQFEETVKYKGLEAGRILVCSERAKGPGMA